MVFERFFERSFRVEKVYIVVLYYYIMGDCWMVGVYSRKWFEVHRLISKAQKGVFKVVEEICGLVEKDIGGFLEELQKREKFTYVIEPLQGDGDIMRCVPCLFVDGDGETFKVVEGAVRERFPEVVSESRLVFERRPQEVVIE